MKKRPPTPKLNMKLYKDPIDVWLGGLLLFIIIIIAGIVLAGIVTGFHFNIAVISRIYIITNVTVT